MKVRMPQKNNIHTEGKEMSTFTLLNDIILENRTIGFVGQKFQGFILGTQRVILIMGDNNPEIPITAVRQSAQAKQEGMQHAA